MVWNLLLIVAFALVLTFLNWWRRCDVCYARWGWRSKYVHILGRDPELVSVCKRCKRKVTVFGSWAGGVG